MCGIAGFIGTGDVQTLKRMQGLLAHRGPDDRGMWHNENVGLAHTRLAIIDPDPRGRQPMRAADDTLHIVFNGEIYNHSNLRAELEAAGHRFRTNTDTEVILEAYRAWGAECIGRLIGMFAFGLYDAREKTLLLARDRMGQKPLYWAMHNNTFVFASELSALTAHPAIDTRINHESLRAYLMHGYIPHPNAIFNNIHKLPPATYAVLKTTSITQHTYWHPESTQQNINERDALDELNARLNTSVTRRLISDVPLGVLLSGGIDSSTIAYYAQENSTERIKTFSIAFDDHSFDESAHARAVAQHLNTDHHEFVCSPHASMSLVEQLGSLIDEPLADPSIIPTLLISQHTKQHVTVALGGDGADELLSGYPTFQADRWYAGYHAMPKPLHRRVIMPVLRALPVEHTYLSTAYKLQKMVSARDCPYAWRHHIWTGACTPQLCAQLLMHPSEYTPRMQFPNAQLNETLIAYQQTYLTDDILAKVDRASMRYGLEVRAPFLDHELVTFINGLPASMKQNGFTSKYLLKKLMLDKLPHTITTRKKQGFAMPIARWLAHDMRTLLRETLHPKALIEVGLFNSDVVQRMIHEHETGRANHDKPLWTLFVFMLWYTDMRSQRA